MRERNIVLSPYLDRALLEQIYSSVGQRPRRGKTRARTPAFLQGRAAFLCVGVFVNPRFFAWARGVCFAFLFLEWMGVIWCYTESLVALYPGPGARVFVPSICLRAAFNGSLKESVTSGMRLTTLLVQGREPKFFHLLRMLNFTCWL